MLTNSIEMPFTAALSLREMEPHLVLLLNQVLGHVRADLGYLFIVTSSGDGVDLLPARAAPDATAADPEVMRRWVRERHQQFPDTGLYIYPPGSLPGYNSGCVWTFAIMQGSTAGVAVFSRAPNQYTQDAFAAVSLQIDLLAMVINHQMLTQRLITTEAMAGAAQAIVRDPTPQNIVHVLKDYVLDEHITQCAIVLFGPVQPDRPFGPFEYAEIAGTWWRAGGSGMGVGFRIMLKDYQTWFDMLEREGFLTFSALDERSTMLKALEEQLDAPLGELLRLSGIASMTVIPLRSPERQLGVLAIASDVPHKFPAHEIRTFQLVAEFLTMTTLAEALQKERDFIRWGRAAVLDAVKDGVVMVLPDDQATVLALNERFSQVFGVAEEDARGRSLRDLLDRMTMPGTVRRELEQAWDAIAPRSTAVTGSEFRMVGPHEAMLDIQWHTAPVYDRNELSLSPAGGRRKAAEVIGRIFTFHDVTPERSNDRLRTELLSRISHELRTPLTSIRGFAEFILQEPDKLPAQAREYLEIILRSATHLNHLFTDVIEIQRATSGALKMDIHNARLQNVVIETVARMDVQVKGRGKRVEMNINDDLPLVMIDTERMSQVLTNLIMNALKYAPEGEVIRVGTTLVTRRDKLPKSAPPDVVVPCILVHVFDQGKGISPEEAEHIFMPFYRSRSARAGKIEGAGLGLTITRSIVELHGGRLWVEPAKRRNMGGRFYFTVPVRE
jgi:signal transduction histidine kinase